MRHFAATVSLLLPLSLALPSAACLVTTRNGPSTPPPVGTTDGRTPDSEPRYLWGTITDSATGKPLPRAAIDITAESTGRVVFTSTTDGNGNYRTGELPSGRFNIRIRREGYQAITRMANVTAGPAQLDIAMIPGR